MPLTIKRDTSDKLHIIDRKTFESIQQKKNNAANEPFLKIRNAKFKRQNHVTCGSVGGGLSLMQFLTKTPKQKQKEKKLKRYNVCILGHHAGKSLKKRGKTREGGKRKKLSKLKKSILRYRRQKRQDLLLEATVESISKLSLDKDDEKQQEAYSNTIATAKESTKNSQGISKIVHSRRFRSYCDNCTTPVLSQLTEQLLRDLDRFQKRAILQNTIKAHAHRRFVVGFREAQSMLLVKKVKIFIIAPDCETCDGEDGLDEKIATIKKQCQQQNVPYLFSLRRRQLAYALFKKAPVGCVAILDFDGAREIFYQIMESLQEARKMYEGQNLNQHTLAQ